MNGTEIMESRKFVMSWFSMFVLCMMRVGVGDGCKDLEIAGREIVLESTSILTEVV